MVEDQSNPIDDQESENSPSDEDLLTQVYSEYDKLKFFSDQARFNSVLYEGFTLIYEKLASIELKMTKLVENLDEKQK